MFGKKNQDQGDIREATKRAHKEIKSFGDLWKCSGYRIMARLLEAYKDEPMGATKAALVYGLGTGLGLKPGKILAREMGARI
jgi:hypothetical protein